MGLASDQIHDLIKEQFGDSVVDDRRDVIDPFLVVISEVIEDLARFARDDDRLDFDLLSLIAGIDYPADSPEVGKIEVVYCLDSTTQNHRLIVKALVPRDNPRIRTLEGVWKTADWHERETFDLMGVIFEGHHNLVRILCAEDWEGHPLRKDYVIPDTYRGLKNVVY